METSSGFTRAQQVVARKQPTLTLLTDLVQELRADAEAAFIARQSGMPRGPITGLHSIDSALGNYLSPGLHLLQGAPGAGKTAFCLQVASDCKFPALYVSVEMSFLALFRRLVSRQTKTYKSKLKDGSMRPEKVEELGVITARALPKLAILNARKEFVDPLLIRDTANAVREMFEAEHCLVIIDSIHAWAKSSRRYITAPLPEYDLINQSLAAMDEIAQDLNCPLMLLVHRNRSGQSNGGMHAAKGSGEFEYYAETQIDLGREQDAPEDKEGNVKVTAKICKNRDEAAGMEIDLNFCGRFQEFTEKL